MAYPGDRRRKTRIAISPLAGEVNFDLPVWLTHADFVDASKTLGGENAMADGGADVAFSLDAEGTIWLAREIVRCELSATPADSRIEIVVTVPASHLSDTVASYIYCWFGSETETQPAPDGLYGKYAVWNGPTRDGFTPLVTWGVWHFNEDPSDPTPQHKDSGGAGTYTRDIASTNATQVDLAPGLGISVTSALYDVADTSEVDTPGTGDWCLISIGAATNSRALWRDQKRISYLYSDNTAFNLGSDSWRRVPTTSGVQFVAASRAGDNIVLLTNTNNDVSTGHSGYDFTGTTAFGIYTIQTAQAAAISLCLNLHCAPNIYWLVALRKNLMGTGFFGTPEASEPAAIAAEIYFDGLNAGTEVRVYEWPHGQGWRVDLDGVTPADLNETVIQFQIQGESTAADHYAWFNYDDTGTDPEPGGTGHAVAIATTDTAADVADTLQGVLDAITDLTATVDGTLVDVLNDRNGELAEPTTDSTAELTLVQIGGTATSAIDGIESSTGTSWTASYTILRPRRARIAMLSIAYENVQLFVVLTTSGVVVPASALQREDPNYANPA